MLQTESVAVLCQLYEVSNLFSCKLMPSSPPFDISWEKAPVIRRQVANAHLRTGCVRQASFPETNVKDVSSLTLNRVLTHTSSGRTLRCFLCCYLLAVNGDDTVRLSWPPWKEYLTARLLVWCPPRWRAAVRWAGRRLQGQAFVL